MLMLSLYCKVKALYATRDRGATAAEYALLLTAVAAIIAVTAFAFGGKLNSLLNATCGQISAKNGTASC